MGELGEAESCRFTYLLAKCVGLTAPGKWDWLHREHKAGSQGSVVSGSQGGKAPEPSLPWGSAALTSLHAHPKAALVPTNEGQG